ncbi:MAG TPA: hypothetical protein VK348_11530 [Planctomycetota bacterium]|nr:hypothetical protein [Planctomycetota bacterium]
MSHLARRTCNSLLLVVVAAGCQHTSVPPFAGPVAHPVVERSRWQITVADQPVGWLVLFEIQDPSAPLQYYRIENQRQQWVGHASTDGHFSRRLPFRDDEQDLGVWSMKQGIARLLEAAGPVELRTVVEADSKKTSR